MVQTRVTLSLLKNRLQAAWVEAYKRICSEESVTLCNQLLNHAKIFTYNDIKRFYETSLQSYEEELKSKMDHQRIEESLKGIQTDPENQKIKVAILLMTAFEVKGVEHTLPNIFKSPSRFNNPEKTWAGYKAMHGLLPELPEFLKTIDKITEALSEKEADLGRLTHDIAEYTTIRDKKMDGVNYQAEFCNRSIYISLSEKKHDSDENYGWKFHISIDDSNEVNLESAWNLVKDILIDHGIANFKIIGQSNSLALGQAGKQMTIYQFDNPDENWRDILQEIEKQLSDCGIKPGGFNDVDKGITGSKYITYRNDKKSNGTYLSAEEARTLSSDSSVWYNPFGAVGAEDPFKNIDLSQPAVETLTL